MPEFEKFLSLCKPKVVALIVFTAVVGMLLAVEGWPPFQPLALGTLGIGLCAASAAALNQLLERAIDARMVRTQHRPLPRGRVSVGQALGVALALGTAGVACLWIWVNPLTAVLTFGTLIAYALIYTLFLKRATPQNIVIGGAAGAAPPLLGWAAMTGELAAPAYSLFLIIFVWTPPHFWALAIYRRDDYAEVAMPMLPVTHGEHFTRWHILFYTVLLFVFSLLPYFSGLSGLFYLFGAVALGLGFLYYAARLLRDTNPLVAMQTFRYSILYLLVLFSFLLIDHYLPFGHPLHA